MTRQYLIIWDRFNCRVEQRFDPTPLSCSIWLSPRRRVCGAADPAGPESQENRDLVSLTPIVVAPRTKATPEYLARELQR